MSTINLHNVDCLEGLRDLPDESVHCCVTSPPYWGLRDYKTEGQIGLEPTLEEFIEKMVKVFQEVRRVLRDDGTLWLNLGDSYAGGGRGGNPEDSSHRKQATNAGSLVDPSPIPPNLKPKDLIGVPWMVAFALRADGWYLRQDIIWHKPNPMPESVQDRCTKAHEYIFLLSKSRQYYYDAAAIREPAGYGDTEARYARALNGHKSNPDTMRNGIRPRQKVPVGWDTEPGTHCSYHRDGRAKKKSGNKERKPGSARGCPEGTGSNVCGSVPWQGDTRNKRSVWTVSTKPFKDAHFATFPEELIEPCILAGCPEGGTVLDPFAGAGTTGVVAARGYRNFIGFEINPEYCEMARKRIEAITRQGRLFESTNLTQP